MANVNLSIDYGAVKECAISMQTVNTNLNNKLEEIRNAMKTVNSEGEDVYISTDAAACKERFEKMANQRFSEFKQVIDEYVKFLNDAVTEYTATSRDVQTNLDSSVAPFV
ncbi:MAG: hypothetical protein J6A19_14215 [Oscillospiraceae bacterium]|nr:hypothetical protein [Oscillospiraceae bacterium]